MIAASDAAIRRGLRLALEANGFSITECVNARTAVEAASWRPDVCLVDLRLALGSASVVARLAERVPSTRIVLLTESDEEADMIEALRAGAVGSLPKNIEPQRLPIALRAILAGEPAIPRRQVHRLIEELRRQQRSSRTVESSGRQVDLTRRELEVLEHLAADRTTGEIAEVLGTSRGTIRSHIHALRQKLGVEPRAAAALIMSGESLRDSTLIADLQAQTQRVDRDRGTRATTGR